MWKFTIIAIFARVLLLANILSIFLLYCNHTQYDLILFSNLKFKSLIDQISYICDSLMNAIHGNDDSRNSGHSASFSILCIT